MKTADMADLHFQGGAHLPVVARAWRQAYDEIFVPRGVRLVNVAGDVLEDPNLAFGRSNTAGDVHHAILEPIARTGIDTVFALGNHDGLGSHHESALACFKGIPEITVVEKPAMLSFDEGRISIAVLPWEWNNDLLAVEPYASMSSEEFAAAAFALRLNKLKKIQAFWRGPDQAGAFKILLGHAEIDGAKNRYRELPPGCTHVYAMSDLLEVGADSLAFGHYHGRQLAYIGAFLQLSHGEEGNPTGVRITDTETGQVEWVEVDAPRFYTVRTEEFEALAGMREEIDASGMNVFRKEAFFRPGIDHVKVRGERPPVVDAIKEAFGTDSLPPGVIFEAQIAAPAGRVLATEAALDADAEVPELIRAFLASKHPELVSGQAEGAEARWPELEAKALPIIAAYHQLLEAPWNLQIKPSQDRGLLPIDRIEYVELRNIGPHVQTRLEFEDGLCAIVGHTGSGKTYAIEAFLAAVWGQFVYYPGPLEDLIREGFQGDALVAAGWQAGGRRFCAEHRIRKTAKTARVEHYLWEIVPALLRDVHEAMRDDGKPCENEIPPVTGKRPPCSHPMEFKKPMAGPNMKDFVREADSLFGTQDQFIVSEFQNQDDAGSLVSMDDSERMEFARRWVGADRFDAAFEITKRAQNQEAMSLLALQGRLSTYENVADEVAAAAAALEAGRQGEGVALAALEERKALVQTRQAELAQIQAARNAEVAARAALEQKTQEGIALRAEVEALGRRLGQLDADLAQEAEHHARVAEMGAIRARKEAVAAAQARCSSIEGERAAVQREIAELEAQISSICGAAAQADASKRMAWGSIIQQANQEIIRESDRVQDRIRVLEGHVTRVGHQRSMLDTAGCKPNFLPCPFIDSARVASSAAEEVELAQARSNLAAGNFALEARQKKAEAEQALQVMEGIEESAPPLASEQRAALEAAGQRLASMPAPHPHDIELAKVNVFQLEADIRERQASELLISGLAAKREERGTCQVTFDQKVAALERLQGEWQALKAALPAESMDLQEAERLLLEAGGLLSAAESDRAAAAAARGAAEEADRKAQARRVEAQELMKRIEEARPRVQVLSDLQEFFSPRGVPQLLIETAIPRINEILSELMADAMPEPMVISLSTQKAQKSKTAGMKEGLFIWVTDGSGTRPFQKHCGGERNLVRKTIRFAIGQFQGERAGRSHGIYCIDEPTIGLDVERLIPRMVNTIYKLAGRYNQVIVIDHNPALLVGIPRKFELAKVNGVTEVRQA